MTVINHRSKEFADKLIKAVNDMTATEQLIREICFDCYCTAYNRGVEQVMSSSNYHQPEDMGR